ncbi:hypothetical protein B0H11DRAFT_1931561 [Mycena galericulata]|nr:hypothetical protein B0H11DRAFT_1931561 [Mycena galericulata]
MICSAHLVDEQTPLFEIDDVLLGATRAGIGKGTTVFAPTTWYGTLTVLYIKWSGSNLSEPTLVEARSQTNQTVQLRFYPAAVRQNRRPLTDVPSHQHIHTKADTTQRRPSTQTISSGKLNGTQIANTKTSDAHTTKTTIGYRQDEHTIHKTPEDRRTLEKKHHLDGAPSNPGDLIRKQANIPTDMALNIWSIPDSGRPPKIAWHVLLKLTIYGSRGKTFTNICDDLAERFSFFRTTDEWKLTYDKRRPVGHNHSRWFRTQEFLIAFNKHRSSVFTLADEWI